MSNEQRHHHWKTERLFFDGDAYFDSVLTAIDSAQKEVLLESYIFEFDPIGQRVLQRLAAAKKRGVQVRVLVDGIGSFNWLNALRTSTTEKNIPFRVYHPLPFSLTQLRRISWKRLRQWLFLFRRINKRNHRKVILVDGEKAFLGSFNISQVHSREFMGDRVWRDTGVFVEGGAVSFLRKSYQHAWAHSRFDNQIDTSIFIKTRVQSYPNSLIRLNSKIRWRFQLLWDLSQKMKLAKHRILVTNAYFLPRKRVLSGLRRAARRGVFVGLCIPAKSDVWFVKAATRSLYLRLLKDGVHIFEYEPTVLHAKTLMIDDWATVGSHNLNHRSIRHDLEAEAVITTAANIQTLIKKWDEDVENSNAISLKELGRFGIWQRMISRIVYWFRYWI